MVGLWLILALGMLYLSVRVLRVRYRRMNMRERLQFAFETPVEAQPEFNLSAGDYGLEGSARFLYFLTNFLASPLGYLGLAGLGLLTAYAVQWLFQLTSLSAPLLGLAIAAGLILLSNLYVSHKRKSRAQRIRFELPNALQSIVAVMEGGLAFESSLQHVIRESGTQHPLYFDLSVMMDAMQRGRRRNEALRLWALRANERSVTDVVAAMIQADQTGAALGGVLRHHATTLLKEIEAELLRKAERIPIYMIFPMMLCILPPIMIVAVGPSVIRIYKMFEAIMSKA